MNIYVQTIKKEDHRYDTTGDWEFDGNGDLSIYVTEMGDWRAVALVAIHELIEALLCKRDGITQAMVDEFDITHPTYNDPGSHPDAPYRRQHFIATMHERMLCTELGLNWEQYEEGLK